MMTEKRRYETSFMHPPTGSRFEFYVAGLTICLAEPPLAPWLKPQAGADDFTSADAGHVHQRNAHLVAIDAALEEDAINALQKAGLPIALLKPPHTPETRAAIAAIKEAYRASLHAVEGALHDDLVHALKQSATQEKWSRDICTRVVNAAFHSFGKRNRDATAKHLNLGMPSGGGLTRHHVTNAVNAERRRTAALAPTVTERILLGDALALAALDLVHAEARKRAEFKRLRGAELAREIHARFDICRRVYRANQILAQRVSAAA